MANKTSQHILTTAANLLGFCLFVITSLHISNTSELTIIDEFTSFVALLLSFSCLLSFISIRTQDPVKEKKLETIADYLFIISLGGIVIIILLFLFRFIK
ncbi:MAG TPA: hypothetical protein VGO58_17965 [Chitinophagaceae bacterium]|nr:hypothetical protein [Chitinophagaceae bacterium]